MNLAMVSCFTPSQLLLKGVPPCVPNVVKILEIELVRGGLGAYLGSLLGSLLGSYWVPIGLPGWLGWHGGAYSHPP